MSALAGIWRFDGRPDAEAACGRMLAVQRIYGPHHSAVAGELAGALALGRNLYRQLPEDACDHQPLTGPTLALVADLRLDNREELGEALGLPGLGELSDADILLAALERWGEDAPPRLHGDFAFAAFDRARRRLLLARSPSGLRPLHYHQGPDCFALATMPKGLHALPEVPRAPDTDAIARGMILHMADGAATAFKDIRRVEPGAILTAGPAGVRSRVWWAPSPAPLRLKRDADYVDACRAELDAAVARCLRGRSAVAAHLSSGFDSSAVATTAARLLAPSGGRVTAFTAVPRAGYERPLPAGAIGDEGPLAALTAAMHPNIDHVLVRPGAASALPDLDRLFHLHDQPMLNLCNTAWIVAINEAARARGLTVLLSGDLGNLGLSYDGMELLPQLLREGRVIELGRQWLALKRNGYHRYRASAARTFGPYMPPWLWAWASRRFRGQGVGVLDHSAVRPDKLAAFEAEARAIHPDLDQRPWRDGVAARLWALQRADRGLSAKGQLAGWGLDRRDPTSDRRLIEFCLSVPAEQFLKDGAPRALARAALADRVPQELLRQRGRGRQGVDWHEGVEADLELLKREIERIGASEAASSVVDTPRLAALAQSWPAGGWERNDVTMTYRVALLRGVSIGHFLRKASGGNA